MLSILCNWGDFIGNVAYITYVGNGVQWRGFETSKETENACVF